MAQTLIPSQNSNFNTGSDGAVAILSLSQGQDISGIYNLGKIVNFHSTLVQEDVGIRTINTGGRELHQTERLAYKGEFTIVRENGDLEQLEDLQRLRKRNGQPELYFDVTHFINNQDGTSNEHLYKRARVQLSDSGTYELGRAVEMKIEFLAEDKVVLS